MVSLIVGKRTQGQTHALVQAARNRLSPGHLPAIFHDGYEGYEPLDELALGGAIQFLPSLR